MAEGIYEESIRVSGSNLILNLIIDTTNYFRHSFSQWKTMGRAETFESWPSEKGVNSK